MAPKLLVFDSHPVQYRVPLWQAISTRYPGMVHVVYGSDCSVRGHADKEFGQTVAWDEPMLSGYDHTILNCEKGEPLSSWGSLTGKGVKALITKIKPDAILLTGMNYRYDAVAYINARRMNIPVWLRCETQDFSTSRSKSKAFVRGLVYRSVYPGFDKIFYIGELNKLHYLTHGVPERKLIAARYCTVDRFANMQEPQEISMRETFRKAAGIKEDSFVIGFSGKFIEKKNPKILYEMQEFLPEELRKRITLYFMGSGQLQKELEVLGKQAESKYGSKTFFSGFVNQTQLPGHYLAMDVMVLPSRRMGETWGLVANEAMQSGAGVIVSSAVGSGADFKSLERFRVSEEGSAKELAKAVQSLATFKRSYNWAKEILKDYSIEATANAFTTQLLAGKK